MLHVECNFLDFPGPSVMFVNESKEIVQVYTFKTLEDFIIYWHNLTNHDEQMVH